MLYKLIAKYRGLVRAKGLRGLIQLRSVFFFSLTTRVLELLTMSSKVCLRAELLSEWSGEERRKTRERRRGDGDGDGDDSSSGLSSNACKLV